ncbi:MAG: hypothetical protein ABNH21_18725 [Glaciecola sp.]
MLSIVEAYQTVHTNRSPCNNMLRFVIFIGLSLLFANYGNAANISVETKNGRQVLIYNGAVESGDAKRVRYFLRNRRVDEVWLKSGGGVLMEGVQIGLYLREAGTMVKVKSGDSCASSCTVAFLGGLIRTIESGAKYQVHAYSGVLYGIPRRRGESQAQLEQRVLSNPQAYLQAVAKEQMRQKGVSWASRLFVYYRLMIQPAPRARLYSISNSSEANGIKRALARYGDRALQLYLEKQMPVDVARIQKEGISAAHEITMRLERDAMQNMLVGLNALNDQNMLKRRAPEAIRILKIMFESRILATSDLSLETLSEYGFTNVPIPN